MTDNLNFKCPSCSTAITAADRYTGAKFPCPTCGQRLQVPGRNRTVLGEPVDDLAGMEIDLPYRAPQPQPAPAPRTPLLTKKAAWYTIGGSSVLPLIFMLMCVGGPTIFFVIDWKASSRLRLEQQVADLIAAKEGVAIRSVILVKKTETEYDGIVTATSGREAIVHVTYDGDRILANWLWRF